MQNLSGDKPWMPHSPQPHLQRSLKTLETASGKPERPPGVRSLQGMGLRLELCWGQSP